MPFKDTPGLRRLVASALAERDVVDVRIRDGEPIGVVLDERTYGPGETVRVSRRRAESLLERGLIEPL
jgi:hypothetical protein